jgi:hypothetical protein
LFFFVVPGGPEQGTTRRCGDFVGAIRAELPASVEKSAAPGSRTNVVLKPAAAEFLFAHPERETAGGVAACHGYDE